jgi:hypothetical protein
VLVDGKSVSSMSRNDRARGWPFDGPAQESAPPALTQCAAKAKRRCG